MASCSLDSLFKGPNWNAVTFQGDGGYNINSQLLGAHDTFHYSLLTLSKHTMQWHYVHLHYCATTTTSLPNSFHLAKCSPLHPALATALLLFSLWIWLLWVLRVNWITQCLSPWHWLLSLSTVFSRCIHAAAYQNSILCLAEFCVYITFSGFIAIVCIYYTLVMHSSINGHLSCFHLLTLVTVFKLSSNSFPTPAEPPTFNMSFGRGRPLHHITVAAFGWADRLECPHSILPRNRVHHEASF